MAKPLARFRGVCLKPGVSLNGRLYEPPVIAEAVKRAQERITTGGPPITVLTHHGAGDDSTRICGRVVQMMLQEDGSASYEAELADTDHSRALLNLIDTDGGTPFLQGVSIRGAWIGKVGRKMVDGKPVECAPGLELDGLDFTKAPGVPGATIDSVIRTDRHPAESADERHLIYESAEALVETITEDTTTTGPATAVAVAEGDVQYADPGYRDDKQKRYPLDSKASAKSAWSALGEAANSRLYTANQMKRIKQRTVKALKRFGVEVNTAEGYLVDPIGAVTEATLQEYYGAESPEMAGSFCIELCNGPLRIAISSYCVDPADLDLIGRAAMDGAALALKSLDPDMDGDMDVPGAPSEDTDDDMETAAESASTEPVTEAGDEPTQEPAADPEPAEDTEDPAPDPAAVPQKEEEEPAVSEPTTPAVEPTPAATESTEQPNALDTLNAKFDKLTDAISGLVSKMAPAPAPAAAAESAPEATAPAQETAPAAEAPAPVAETQEQMIQRLVDERMKDERVKLIQETVEATGPARKGLVAPVNEHTAPAATEGWPEGWPVENGEPKPVHKWNETERLQHMVPAMEQYVLGSRART